MNDHDFKMSVRKIQDPMEMLSCILGNEHFLGYDLYYADIRKCILDQAYKVLTMQ